MGRPQRLDYELIRHLYVDRQLSSSQVGEVVGCYHSAVIKALKKMGVPRREPGPALSLANATKPRGKGLDEHGYKRRSIGGKKIRGHRAIAEQILGRGLLVGEVVHHCNEIKSDNRPENLWVFPSKSSHARFHQSGIIDPNTIFLGKFINGHRK